MRQKILKTMILTTFSSLMILGIAVFCLLMFMKSGLISRSEEAGNEAKIMSGEAMTTQTEALLTEMSSDRAKLNDAAFSNLREACEMAASSTALLYDHPERFGTSSLEPAKETQIGQKIPMVAFADASVADNPEVLEELGLLANLQNELLSQNRQYDDINSDYVATESGLFLTVEEVTPAHIVPEGEQILFDARTRPWYEDAKEAGATVFTAVFLDADSGKPTISCGTPIYGENGTFLGVSGAGMYLDSMQQSISDYQIGENGFFCIVNQDGQVLFSGREIGEMGDSLKNGTDLRTSSDSELAQVAKRAVDGEQDIVSIPIEGQQYYVAFAPMPTVGWSYLAILPEKEVTAPTEALYSMLLSNTEKTTSTMNRVVLMLLTVFAVILLLLLGVVALLAMRLADRLVKPIEQLTDGVQGLEGDKLDFTWEQATGDEIETLGRSFASMTRRMKTYIEDITRITAEKERIGAELSVATNIQASMLPSIFPAFPEREEFDLYAKMDPAKEVGGDFYDFFMTDKDHLAVVIADVSGKGVPASLFMVIAKTLIKNHGQLMESVDKALQHTNDQLCEGNGECMFVTAWIGILDLRTGELEYADAGHDNPYLIHQDGSFDVLAPESKLPPLAVMEDLPYCLNRTKMVPGDMLFLYTDGVPEATDAHNELYGMGRLEEVVKTHYGDAPEVFLTEMRADVDRFVGEAPQFDDLTMLGLRLKKYSSNETT